jgi:phospholipid/cholesterol/gamma-HCH transport system substrate-binding protein
MKTKMSKETVIARAVTLIAAIAAVLVVVSVFSGGANYVLNITIADAGGLRPQSDVLVGGVPVGSVGTENMNQAGNAVVVQLNLDPSKVTIGQGAKVTVVTSNLLGEKAVLLTPGNAAQPLPSGTTLPESVSSLPTDIDQVTDILNPQARTDLAILLREVGIAVAGRKADVSALLAQLPPSLTAATQLLNGVITDNHTLADFVGSSSAFITRMDAQGAALKQLIGTAADASVTFAQRAASLSAVVQKAPQFLSEVNDYFGRLTTDLNNLNPEAGQLSQSAAPLDAVLKEIKPFSSAAIPVLNRAAAVAP